MALNFEMVIIFIGDFIRDSLPELIGAGVGAYLGYKYGLKLDRTKRIEEERQKKDEIVKSLLTENSDIKSVLDKGLNGRIYRETKEIKFLNRYLFTDSFKSTIYSGNYQLLSIETQRYLTWFYSLCERMNELTSNIGKGFFSHKDAININFEIKELYSNLVEGVVDVEKRLQKELEKPYSFKISQHTPIETH